MVGQQRVGELCRWRAIQIPLESTFQIEGGRTARAAWRRPTVPSRSIPRSRRQQACTPFVEDGCGGFASTPPRPQS
jgi:hypothetical protein